MDTTTEAYRMADQLVQMGRDEMAAALADWFKTIAAEDQMYRDGAEDALVTLIHHGATDPR